MKIRDIYIIININTNKNLVYKVILVVIGGFVLVISLIITLIEDQIKAV